MAIHHLRSTQAMHGYSNERGLNPKMHVMDNQCPDTVKEYMCDNKIDFQLVPPHIHCTNATEKSISTFKDHFLAGLCSVHPNVPMRLWCRLIPLATTLSIFSAPRGSTQISRPKCSSTEPLTIIKQCSHPLIPKFSCMKHLRNAAPGSRTALTAGILARRRSTTIATAFLCCKIERNISHGP